MNFKFGKKETKRCLAKIDAKLEKAIKQIAPSPFPIDARKTTKKITVTVDENGKETIAESVKEQIIMGKFCIVLDRFDELSSIWYKASKSALLVASYIRHKMLIGSNLVELTEKEFCQFAGVSRTLFYDGISVLLRPNTPNHVAGDSLALLSATTKKSVYVVNHNLLFKGNYDEFITLLTTKYPDGCKLDERGRVILD